MSVPRCGKCKRRMTFPGPHGGYVCGHCWHVVPPPDSSNPVEVPTQDTSITGMHCEHCGTEITYGPDGGYVCGMCNHVVEPPGAAKTRKNAAKERANRQRRAAEERAMRR